MLVLARYVLAMVAVCCFLTAADAQDTFTGNLGQAPRLVPLGQNGAQSDKSIQIPGGIEFNQCLRGSLPTVGAYCQCARNDGTNVVPFIDLNCNNVYEPGSGDFDVGSGGGGGGGDITDVFNCTSGDCSQITVAGFEVLDFGNVVPDSPNEGLILPRSFDCSEISGDLGQVCTNDPPAFGLWVGDGTDSVLIGPTPTPDLNQVTLVGRSIFGADCATNPVEVVSGTTTLDICIEAGQPVIRGDCNGSPCPTIIDKTGGKITIDDAFNVTLEAGAKELISEPLKMPDAAVDGTQCTKGDAAIGDALIASAATCAIHVDAEIQFTVLLGDRWDAGAVSVEWYVSNVNASPAGTYRVNWSSQCRGLGEVLGSFGSPQPVIFDFDNTGTCGTQCAQNAAVSLTTTNITPAGSCAKGDFLVVRGTIDASSGTGQASDIRHMGGQLRYLADDWSDD